MAGSVLVSLRPAGVPPSVSHTGQPLGLCNASHVLGIAGPFQPGRPGQGRRNCGSDAVLVRAARRLGQGKAGLAWLRLSLQVQALDPRRHTP